MGVIAIRNIARVARPQGSHLLESTATRVTFVPGGTVMPDIDLLRRRVLTTFAAAWLAAIVALVLAAMPAHAQQSDATLRGTITAPGGSEATQVVAIDIASGYRKTSDVGPDGQYHFASLRPGRYRLEVVTPAGSRSTDEFTLLVGHNFVLDFDFSEPALEEVTGLGAVMVVGNHIRRTEGGEVGVNITQQLIEQLPQNNRNFLAFADLAPGVAFVTGDNGATRIQGGAQDSRTVNVFIDGVGQKDYVLKNGVTGQDSSRGNPFPQSAISEYRVISSNYKAEFDQVSSVAITAVTRSGTNEFEADLFVDDTDEGLREKTPFEKSTGAAKVDTRDQQFGAVLGGPVVRDLLHFFATYEGKRREDPVDFFPGTTQNTANIPAGFQDDFGSFSRVFDEDLFFGKINFAPSDRDLFELSVKVRKETGEGINSGTDLFSTVSETENDETRGLLRYERSADTWINDLKLTWEESSWAPTPRAFENAFLFQDAVGAQIFRTGGSANFQDKGQDGYGIQNDFTYTGISGHTLKAGVKAKWVELNALTQNNVNARYDFNTQYMAGADGWNDELPYRVEFGFASGEGNPVVESDNFQLGLYVQDDWDVTDRLALNLGLRWDYDETPTYEDFVHSPQSLAAVSPANYPNLVNADYDINDFISTGSERSTFTDAFQPRIGFSYTIDPESRLVVFGGAGRSYDRNQFDFIQQETSVGSFTNRTFNFQVPGDARNDCAPGPTCVPWDPIYLTPEGRAQLVASVGPLGGAELRFITNDLEVPYSDQFSLGLRRAFGPLEAEIGAIHIESRDGFVWLLGNRRPDGSFFAPGTTEGSPFGFPPPGRGSIIIGDNGIETDSDAFYLKLTKIYTPSSPWQLNASYTYTDAEENRKFGETFSLDFPSINDYPTLTSVGVSRHRFAGAAIVDLPWDFSLSAKLTLASPPYVIGRGFPGEPFGNRELRVVEGDNENTFVIGDLWALRQMDLALTKYFSLPFLSANSRARLRIDVLNVFNEKNFTQYNDNGTDDDPNDANGSFGNVSGLGIGGNPPRTFKLSAGFSF